MKVYKAYKEDINSNTVIKELNARISTSTFASKRGVQKGDLYEDINCSNCIVSHGTCAPANFGKYLATICIKF
jgi:hypothetical protein